MAGGPFIAMPRILVVDDSSTMRHVVSLALEKAGYETEDAEDGTDALEKVERRNFDLIISDVNMPKMDGIELVRAIRARPESRFVPVVLLTTEWKESRKAEGKAAGATGWIVKPFHPEKLLAVVKRVLG